MRVLLITGSFPPMRCGVGDYSSNLVKTLAASPETTMGVLTSVSGGSEVDGIEVFAIMKKWSLAEALKVIKLIWHWCPDIVHIQYPTQGYGNGLLPWLLPMISFMMNKKVVQTWHDGYTRRKVPLLFLKSIVPSTLVVVRSQYMERLQPILRWLLRSKKFLFIRSASAIPRIELGNHERSALRRRYLKTQKRLIVFFGFVVPNKHVKLLLEIADPALDHILIAGEIDERGDYYREIMTLASAKSWSGKVTITGFLPPGEVAALLAVADAVILPFRGGGGEWNSSLHGAVLQGTFVITTSLTLNGYDQKRNVYYAKVDNVQEMKSALNTYAGARREYSADLDKDEWQQIAKDHRSLYNALLSES